MNIAVSDQQFVASPSAEAQHGLGDISWPEIVLLHLGPGALGMGFIIVVAPLLSLVGVPPDLGVLLGFTVVANVARTGYLFYRGKLRSGRVTLHGAVAPWWRPIPVWQFGGLYFLLATYAIVLYNLCSPLSHYLDSHFFSWLPPYLRVGWSPVHAGFARSALLAWGVLLVVMNGVVNPVVEELYFRGNLLPRMLPKLGWSAPIISAALFGLQHFWQPFNLPFVFLLFVAIGPVVIWKRNLALGIAVHSTVNVLGAILVLVSILTS